MKLLRKKAKAKDVERQITPEGFNLLMGKLKKLREDLKEETSIRVEQKILADAEIKQIKTKQFNLIQATAGLVDGQKNIVTAMTKARVTYDRPTVPDVKFDDLVREP